MVLSLEVQLVRLQLASLALSLRASVMMSLELAVPRLQASSSRLSSCSSIELSRSCDIRPEGARTLHTLGVARRRRTALRRRP